MKKLIVAVLIVAFLVGFPLVVLSVLPTQAGDFIIPDGYRKIVVDFNKKDRSDETVLEVNAARPEVLDFYIQTDSEAYKEVKIVGDKKLLGIKGSSFVAISGTLTLVKSNNATPSFVLDKGKYKVAVSNVKSNGKLMICYKEKPITMSEFKRLAAIDSGDLKKPPEGYRLVSAVDLSRENCAGKSIYTISMKKEGRIGFSIYSNAQGGNFDVRLVGENMDMFLLSNNYTMCDQCVPYLHKGTYEIRLDSKNTNGDLYVYVKD